MRKIFTILLILFNQICFSQGLNGELSFNDDYYQYSNAIVTVDEFSYFTKQQHHSSSFFYTCSLIKVDTMGNIVWSSVVSTQIAENIRVYEIIPSENGGVYLLGHGMPACDIIGNCFWFIQKYSANGSVEWTNTWSDPDCFQNELKGLSLSEANQVLVNFSNANESKIYTLEFNGVISDSLAINRKKLNSINDLSGFDKLAYAEDSLFGFDGNGNVSDSIGFSTTIQDFRVFNDTLFLITEDSIHIFNFNLEEIVSTGFSGFSDFTNLKVDNNKISFISHSANAQNVLSLNRNLTLINNLPIPLSIEKGTPKDFNDFHFATNINFPLTLFRSIRHLDYSLKSSQNVNVNTTDIGIVDILPTQVEAHPLSGFSGVYNYEIYVDVLVKNFGSNTLNDCRINHFISESYVCGFNYYSEHFSNLNLAPNDSVWLTLGLIHSETAPFSGSTFEKEICVYTSHPNFKTDLNVSNDQHCQNIIIGYANTAEHLINEIKIYPNPSNQSLNIELPSIVDNQIMIYDATGKIVDSFVDKNLVFSKDVSHLNNGIYYINFVIDDAPVRKKFIVQH